MIDRVESHPLQSLQTLHVGVMACSVVGETATKFQSGSREVWLFSLLSERRDSLVQIQPLRPSRSSLTGRAHALEAWR